MCPDGVSCKNWTVLYVAPGQNEYKKTPANFELMTGAQLKIYVMAPFRNDTSINFYTS